MLTPSCQYALRALVHLSQSQADSPVQAREIAASEGIPQAFLSKILQTLVQNGLVRSQKGPGGGYVLGRAPGQISLQDVLVAVDGVQQAADRCLFGHSECNSLVACPVHDAWVVVRSKFNETIGALTIRELAAKSQTPRKD